ncbi:MAG: discoidin domain-containing protein [bacterium]|jgi:hypothetical protein|nr:discoidin domain-containing protein [bacterium]MDD4153150.1 discoidin domain-containing protein [bacterium]MDD4558270.1 discoidin domain-containing protein [bacterium]
MSKIKILICLSLSLVLSIPAFAASGGSNLLDISNGGKLISFTSQYNDNTWAAANLIDEKKTDCGWSSSDAVFPQELVFAFKDEAVIEINKVSMLAFVRDIDVRWIKDFEILVSTSGPREGFASVGNFRLELRSNRQDFYFKPVKTKYLMIRVLSNWGSNRYAEIFKLGAYEAMQSDKELDLLINRLEQVLNDLKAYKDTH